MSEEQIKILINTLHKIFNDDSLKIAYTNETKNDIIDLQYITLCLNKIHRLNINDNNFTDLIIKPITGYIYTAELNNYLEKYTNIAFNGKSIGTIMIDLFKKIEDREDLINKIECIYNNKDIFIEELNKSDEFDNNYKEIIIHTLFSEYATDLSNKILRINNLFKKIASINLQIKQIENEKLLNSYAKFLNNPILSNLIKVFDSQQRSRVKFKDITDWYIGFYPMIIMIKLMEYIIKHDFDKTYVDIFIGILNNTPTINQILEIINKCDSQFLQYELIPYIIKDKTTKVIEFNGKAKVLLPTFNKQNVFNIQNVINELNIIMNIKRIINIIENNDYIHNTESLFKELNKYTNQNDLMNYINLYGQLNSLLNSIDKFQKFNIDNIFSCLNTIGLELNGIAVDENDKQLKQIILEDIECVLQNRNDLGIIKCCELDNEKDICNVLLLKIKLENDYTDQCYSYICRYLYNITGNEQYKLFATYFDMVKNNYNEINKIIFFNLFKKLNPTGNINEVNKNAIINIINNDAKQVVEQALKIKYDPYDILNRFLKNIYTYISNLTNGIERKIDELLFKYYHSFYDLYDLYCNFKINEKIDDRLLIYYFKELLNIINDEF